ncbi:MAG: hypothetical protein V9G14_00535 [Cypionkella sp.]
MPDLESQENLGLIYDKTEGMVFLLHYGRLREIFSRSDFKKIKNWRQVVQGYLEDPAISSLPFKRLGKEFPENAQAVFKALLKRKAFSIEDDLPFLIKTLQTNGGHDPPHPRHHSFSGQKQNLPQISQNREQMVIHGR